MKRNWKSLLVLMTVMLCAVLLTVAAAAEGEIVDSGKCGDDLTWTLYEDGLLEISGTGEMWDYDNNENTSPWRKYSYSSKFETLILNEGIVSIGDYAFAFCQSLKGSLIIPDSVTKIGERAFNSAGFTGDLVIGNNVTTIGEGAFCWCDGFTGNLVIGKSVTNIGNSAFFDCSSLTGNLTIPDSVTEIGSSAFCGCTGFTGSLTIPDSVSLIGNGAFQNCSNFTGSLTIGNHVTSIGSSAFCGCTGLVGVLTIPDSVTTIGKSAFSGLCGFTGSLTIPDKVTIIGDGAFSDCTGFTGSLTIPDSVTEIGAHAFAFCTGFAGSLTIGRCVSSIGDSAFCGCTGFTGAIIIPDSVVSIGRWTFEECTGITAAYFSGNAPDDFSWVVFLDCADDFTIFYHNGAEGFDTPEWNGYPCYPMEENPSANIVKNGQCGDNLTWTLYKDGLLEISGTGDMWNYEPWGDGVAPWSEYASKKSFKLTTLKLNEGVTSIGHFAFFGCKDFSGTLNFPESVTIVGENAFMGCSGFTGKLVIPCNLKGFRDWAFAGMKGISEIEVESGNTALCAIDGILYSKNKQSLVLCPAGRTKKVEIEPTTVRIENFAFYGCSGLTGQLVIPESVTSIGLVAFENCSGLMGDLIIPKKVDRIYQRAFSGCSGISNVYFEGDAPSDFGSDVFKDCGENLTLYYLNGNEGWTTPEWNGYPCYPYGDAPETVDATGVSLDKTTADLTVGDTLTLIATVAPDDATDKSVTWETSDPTVATVDNGVVTAVAEGTATVTVTTKDGGFKAECAVTVKAAPVPGEYERGDVNGDNKLDSNDAIYLLRHTMSPSRYEINQSGDVNGDGKVDSNDAIYLLRHTMSPGRYPLK